MQNSPALRQSLAHSCPQKERRIRRRGVNAWKTLVVALALLAAPVTQVRAQSLFATLTGVVSDPSGAVVPGAAVKLINERSGSTRDTVTNAEGYAFKSDGRTLVGSSTEPLVLNANEHRA